MAVSYYLRVPLSEQLTTWSSAGSTYGDWQDEGGVHSCGEWAPDASGIEAGISFLQSRTCMKDQTRTITTQEYDSFSNTYRYVDSADHRSLAVNESQNAIGSLQNDAGTSYVRTYNTFFSGRPSGYISFTYNHDDKTLTVSWENTSSWDGMLSLSTGESFMISVGQGEFTMNHDANSGELTAQTFSSGRVSALIADGVTYTTVDL